MAWWYIPFANHGAYLGGVIVEADNKVDAFTKGMPFAPAENTARGFIAPIPEKDYEVAKRFANRLLSRIDMEQIGDLCGGGLVDGHGNPVRKTN